MDLFSALRPSHIDVLVFNPPYVPTPQAPTPQAPTPQAPTPQAPTPLHPDFDVGISTFEAESRYLELTYAGGPTGMATTDTLLRVLSERGVLYLLLCMQNKPEEVAERLRRGSYGGSDGSEGNAQGGGVRWKVEKVGSSGRKSGWEVLSIWRVWSTSTNPPTSTIKCNGLLKYPSILHHPSWLHPPNLPLTLLAHQPPPDGVCFGIVGVWGWVVTIQGIAGAVRRGEGMSGGAGGLGGSAMGIGGLFRQQNRQSNDTTGSVGRARFASNQSRRRWKRKGKARDDDDDDDNGHENSFRIRGERGKGKAGTSSYGGPPRKKLVVGCRLVLRSPDCRRYRGGDRRECR
ncbi:hypothetical protein BDZ91DRAFT_767969 [Kalaharituber pfeilii]|nr:hypothetical protein BDZ91DRAFT_767969 [Kalaharituber pfeilii]